MTTAKGRKNDGVAPVPEREDWHRADIKAALEKAGWSLRQLSIHHGVTPKCFQHAMWRPYPKGEKAIADAIGRKPEEIWPSRYGSDGKPNRRRGKKPRNPTLIVQPKFSSDDGMTELLKEVDDE